MAPMWHHGYRIPVAHMARDPTPGAPTKEADCAECGKRTTWDLLVVEGDHQLGQRDESDWYCTGLTAEEFSAGK
jgi:hypothetical protein